MHALSSFDNHNSSNVDTAGATVLTSPIKETNNVLLEPIQIPEQSLTPMKNQTESQTRQIHHKKSIKKVLQPLNK